MKLVLSCVVVFLTWQCSLAAWYANCGKSKYADVGTGIPDPDPMIVGGVEARPNEFPWQVSYRRTSTRRHFCGAVIITPRWVLTAAHCADGETAEGSYVTVGEHDRTASSSPSRKDYELEEIIEHEDYGVATNYDADIALLKTKEPIVFNEDVQPACAPSDPSNQNVGDLSLVSGWGTIRSGGSSPDILRYTTIRVISEEACENSLGGITPGTICAGKEDEMERDTCQGDSGGPLVVKKNDAYEVVGLTSWGRGCASGTPGAYARVGYYYDWVTQRVGGL